MVLGMYPGAAAAPGTDYAGTVLAAGPNTNVLPGTQVIGFAHGALGTVVLASATTCAPLPPSLTPREGAALPTVCMTAQAALDIANVQASERVLVHALAGGVGMAAMQLLASRGACVVGTASGSKRATLRGMMAGGTTVLDSRSTAFAAVLCEEQVDAVLNSLTSPGMIAASLAVCQVGARYVCFWGNVPAAAPLVSQPGLWRLASAISGARSAWHKSVQTLPTTCWPLTFGPSGAWDVPCSGL